MIVFNRLLQKILNNKKKLEEKINKNIYHSILNIPVLVFY